MSIVNSISGMRATIDELTTEFIEKYANAFNSFLPAGKIIIGRDGRPSGKKIEKTLIDTFVKLEREIEVLDIVPTPTVQLMVEHSNAVGGIIITASHNPSNWNGLKFLNSNGIFLDAEENKKFWYFLDKPKEYNNNVLYDSFLTYNRNSLNFHIDKILSVDFIKENLTNIYKKNYTVVVDAVNASGSVIICDLLKRLNCNVIKLYCDGTGIFPHIPEPLPVNLTDLSKAVIEYKADLGVAVDPDADRLVLVDNFGNNISEENTICIAIQSILELTKLNDLNIVVNQSTTQLVDDIANLYNCHVMRSAVGEINVVKKMQEVSAIIGGEGSGGVILPVCHYGRDSLVGICLVLSLLAKKNINIYDLIAKYPYYEISKVKKNISSDFNDIKNILLNKYKYNNISLIDGIKIYFNNRSWVHIRPSNTEPIIRIIAEAEKGETLNIIKDIENDIYNFIN